MNKSDLKKLIKPLVKECINEVLIEEGLLSNVVSEVARGMQSGMIIEQKTIEAPQSSAPDQAEIIRKRQSQREQLMRSIGEDAYNGVNLFEGTSPLSAHENTDAKPGNIDLGSPTDAGVDISSVIGGASKMWNAMK